MLSKYEMIESQRYAHHNALLITEPHITMIEFYNEMGATLYLLTLTASSLIGFCHNFVSYSDAAITVQTAP